MAWIEIDNLHDPRLAAYRNLKQHGRTMMAHGFIAEGQWVVERMLASGWPVQSLLLGRSRVAQMAPMLDESMTVYVMDDRELEQLLGFKFHRGVLACGRHQPPPDVDALMRQLTTEADTTKPMTLVVCPGPMSAENLGSVIRLAAAFAVDGLILGPQCLNPFNRRTIRVSMGNLFRLPMAVSSDMAADLRTLGECWQVRRLAGVCDHQALPLSGVTRPRQPDRVALLLGSEDYGLPAQIVDECDQRVTIPMPGGTDSLNVANAAAVLLYHLAAAPPDVGH